MRLSRKTVIAIALVVTSSLGIGWACERRNALRRERALQDAALRGDSLAAVLDSTRVLRRGDSVYFARRIVQEAQRADALDDSLQLERRATYTLTLTVRELIGRVAEAPVTADSTDSLRSARFTVREPPYTATADVALPRPPGSGRLSLGVRLDPATLRARVGCGEPVAGIRPATLTLETPAWLAWSLDSLSQDPVVCQGKAGLPPAKGGYGFWRIVKDVLLVAGGFVIGAF